MIYLRLAILAGLIAIGWAVYDFVADARDHARQIDQSLRQENVRLEMNARRLERENARQQSRNLAQPQQRSGQNHEKNA